MKSRIRNIAIALGLVSFSATADLYQPPIPLEEEKPMRVLVGINTQTNFVGVSEIAGGASFIHRVVDGVHWGVNLFGGVQDHDHKLMQEGSKLVPVVTADLTLGYWPMITPYFGLGLSAVIGYTHRFDAGNGLAPGRVDGVMGIPFTLKFTDMLRCYFMPAMGFGEVDADNAIVFGRLLNLELQFGLEVGINKTFGVMLQGAPVWADIRDFSALDGEFLAGLTIKF